MAEPLVLDFRRDSFEEIRKLLYGVFEIITPDLTFDAIKNNNGKIPFWGLTSCGRKQFFAFYNADTVVDGLEYFLVTNYSRIEFGWWQLPYFLKNCRTISNQNRVFTKELGLKLLSIEGVSCSGGEYIIGREKRSGP